MYIPLQRTYEVESMPTHHFSKLRIAAATLSSGRAPPSPAMPLEIDWPNHKVLPTLPQGNGQTAMAIIQRGSSESNISSRKVASIVERGASEKHKRPQPNRADAATLRCPF